MKNLNENPKSPYFAVIDLGSNSFHMLITRQLDGSVQVVDKIKRKVRLAAGLDKDNVLSEQAIIRALICLSFFAERLQTIPTDQIRIVATAAVRLAKNSTDFLNRANKILGRKIELLSGQQEAEFIYLGNAYTASDKGQRLIVDIGGASTELIVGTHLTPQKIVSLNMGCVTLNQAFFLNGVITEQAFNEAKSYAANTLKPIIAEYIELGWEKVFGGSGTMQALAEILLFTKKAPIITDVFLKGVEKQILAFDRIENIQLAGLKKERVAVFVSGVAILSAIFDCLKIKALQLSNGALREGLLYQMLPQESTLSIRQQTIKSLMQHYQVDQQYAINVKNQAIHLYDSCSKAWQLNQDDYYQVLLASCELHEIGLLLTYKNYQNHSAYIIEHADLKGFNQIERQLLRTLIQFHRGDIALAELQQTLFHDHPKLLKLLIILRLSIILCRQRNSCELPAYEAYIEEGISLSLQDNWLAEHPLIQDELNQEADHLKAVGYQLNLC